MVDSPSDRKLLRFSLVFVWLATAVASVFELDGQSTELLSAAGVRDPSLASGLIWGGAIVDAALGLALWFRPARSTYVTALGAMLLMTLAATALSPRLWLHPLGPLTKNVPIAAVLWLLVRERR
jgi:hypothetical protein